MRQILLIGNDVSDRVIAIPEIVTTAGDFGQLTVNDLPSIEGNNRDGFWDQTNEASPFYGARELSKYDIEIFNEGVCVYLGTIQGIQTNNTAKTATVTLKSTIQRNLEKGLKYASGGISNPSIMVQEICSQYKIDIDASSFGRASSIYELNEVRTSALFKSEGTVFDAIQQILEVGIARVYLQNNRLYYDVYRDKDVDPVFVASDKHDNPNGITLFSHPEIITVEKEPLTGYSIKHTGVGGESIYGNTNDQGKSIDGSSSSPVRINTAQAATWIGEQWLAYFGKPQQIINYSIPSRYGKSLMITDPNGIEYLGRDFNVDIISLNNTLVLESKIGGITR